MVDLDFRVRLDREETSEDPVRRALPDYQADRVALDPLVHLVHQDLPDLSASQVALEVLGLQVRVHFLRDWFLLSLFGWVRYGEKT